MVPSFHLPLTLSCGLHTLTLLSQVHILVPWEWPESESSCLYPHTQFNFPRVLLFLSLPQRPAGLGWGECWTCGHPHFLSSISQHAWGDDRPGDHYILEKQEGWIWVQKLLQEEAFLKGTPGDRRSMHPATTSEELLQITSVS